MLNLQIIDIGLGLIFVYLLLSLICSAVNEVIANLLDSRFKKLETTLKNMFEGDGDVKDLILNHELVKPLLNGKSGAKKMLSYIPGDLFATVFLDLSEKEDKIKKLVTALGVTSGIDLQKQKQIIESWFDNVMLSVSSWYKRKTQLVILALSFIIAIIANADTIQLVNSFSQDRQMVEQVVKAAEAYTRENDASTQNPKFENLTNEISKLQLPIGWNSSVRDFALSDWISKLLGIIITSLAVSLGAPFWFDLLGKVINVRSVGVSPEEKNKKRVS